MLGVIRAGHGDHLEAPVFTGLVDEAARGHGDITEMTYM